MGTKPSSSQEQRHDPPLVESQSRHAPGRQQRGKRRTCSETTRVSAAARALVLLYLDSYTTTKRNILLLFQRLRIILLWVWLLQSSWDTQLSEYGISVQVTDQKVLQYEIHKHTEQNASIINKLINCQVNFSRVCNLMGIIVHLIPSRIFTFHKTIRGR